MIQLVGLTDYVASRAKALGCSEDDVLKWLLIMPVEPWAVEAKPEPKPQKPFSWPKLLLKLLILDDRR